MLQNSRLKLVIASSNAGKLREFGQLLSERFCAVSLAETDFDGEIEECGKTFFENALIKARAVSDALGVCALADDSGLCVDALDGAPGVYSARYAGIKATSADNNAKLLRELSHKTNRNAKFVACIVLYFPNGSYAVGNGETHGRILTEPCGKNGFGYDPLFYSNELNQSFAIASEAEKNAVSHRSRALSDLYRNLESGKLAREPSK